MEWLLVFLVREKGFLDQCMKRIANQMVYTKQIMERAREHDEKGEKKIEISSLQTPLNIACL